MKLKPPAAATDFKRKFIERAKVLSGRKFGGANLINRINSIKIKSIVTALIGKDRIYCL